MSSELKVDTISAKTANGPIALNSEIKLKQYTTAQIDALTGMTAGEMVYDTDEQKIKTYNGTASLWEKVTSAGSFSATGGTTSTDGNYTLHTFTSSGTFTCLLYTSPSPRDYAASRMPSSA